MFIREFGKPIFFYSGLSFIPKHGTVGLFSYTFLIFRMQN